MTLPLERFYSENNDIRHLELTNTYMDLANAINGKMTLWIPEIYGSTIAGTVTYGIQEGWYYRQGILTDLWFKVSWMAIGAATGDLYIDLPFESKITINDDFWIGTASFSQINLQTNYENLIFKVKSNSRIGYFEKLGSFVASMPLAIPSSGTLGAHIRYYGIYTERA